jgi:hypothetical protein
MVFEKDSGDIAVAGLMWTRMDEVLGGAYISYLATRERLQMLLDVEWYDPSLDRRSNKHNMKQLGGAYLQYLTFLKTSAILALAKAIEDVMGIARREAGITLTFWRDADRFEHAVSAKEVRALANALKHNESRVAATDSESSAFLVRSCGYRDGELLSLRMIEDKGLFDIADAITKIYCFLASLTEYVSGVRHAVLDLPEADRGAFVRRGLIPEVLGFDQRNSPERPGSVDSHPA